MFVVVVVASAAGWLAINADVDCALHLHLRAPQQMCVQSVCVSVCCVCVCMCFSVCVCEPKVLQGVDFVDLPPLDRRSQQVAKNYSLTFVSGVSFLDVEGTHTSCL